jgi:hypothetical protein
VVGAAPPPRCAAESARAHASYQSMHPHAPPPQILLEFDGVGRRCRAVHLPRVCTARHARCCAYLRIEVGAVFGLYLISVGAEVPDTIQSVTVAKRGLDRMPACHASARRARALAAFRPYAPASPAVVLLSVLGWWCDVAWFERIPCNPSATLVFCGFGRVRAARVCLSVLAALPVQGTAAWRYRTRSARRSATFTSGTHVPRPGSDQSVPAPPHATHCTRLGLLG